MLLAFEVITKQSSIDYTGNYKSSEKARFLDIAQKESTTFSDIRSEYEILKFYNKMKSERSSYTDGSKR